MTGRSTQYDRGMAVRQRDRKETAQKDEKKAKPCSRPPVLTALGRKPQEARVVLPLDTNTELVHTAFLSDWKHFFDLRALGTTRAPHPDAKAVALPLYEEMKKRFSL